MIETLEGTFLGDCGLTFQAVGAGLELEVGYHVRTAAQGRGFATEAATRCLEFARTVLGAPTLVAIIDPDNIVSQRVAEKIGLRFQQENTSGGPQARRWVYGMHL